MSFKLFFGGKLEKEVLELIEEHLDVLCTACEVFERAIENNDDVSLRRVCEFEEEGDRIRRDIALRIYEGAFLPYLRPNIYKFAEIVDEALDELEDCVYEYLYLDRRDLIDFVKEDILKIAELNKKASKRLLEAYKLLVEGEDLSEATIKIRIYEKTVDGLKHDIHKKIRQKEISDFWEGMTFYNFLTHIVSISDLIEDAADLIQIINVSLK
uniref:TIGR00153 family protein n=1 Tax=Geoglobus ahangari TaxID=113653 RepID=A0A7C3YQ62_9EURY